MKKSKFSEEQIAMALRQVEGGAPIPEVTRPLGISGATFSVWQKAYGQMAIAEIRRLRQLEEENRTLKQLVADLVLGQVVVLVQTSTTHTAELSFLQPAARNRMTGTSHTAPRTCSHQFSCMG
jgi:putative transposase